ncbi:hypothetical protein Bbelb_278560 [Branchiostoma belcheri]|nr:hypothetical protein Bbelb_278560 [Branchiostoma belcheri]
MAGVLSSRWRGVFGLVPQAPDNRTRDRTCARRVHSREQRPQEQLRPQAPDSRTRDRTCAQQVHSREQRPQEQLRPQAPDSRTRDRTCTQRVHSREQRPQEQLRPQEQRPQEQLNQQEQRCQEQLNQQEQRAQGQPTALRERIAQLESTVQRLAGTAVRNTETIREELLEQAKRPVAIFDPLKAMALMESLMDTARNEGHEKAEEFKLLELIIDQYSSGLLRQVNKGIATFMKTHMRHGGVTVNQQQSWQYPQSSVHSFPHVPQPPPQRFDRRPRGRGRRDTPRPTDKCFRCWGSGHWAKGCTATAPTGKANIPSYELQSPVNPLEAYGEHVTNIPKWTSWRKDGVSIVPPSPQAVAQGTIKASAKSLIFRDPRTFKAGELHKHAAKWNEILASGESDPEVGNWINNGVNMLDFIQPFKGIFKGVHYDSAFPPPAIFPNNPNCALFAEFISNSIRDRIKTGAIAVWGRVGTVKPPYVVSPLTVEPNKPRLCLDLRYVNKWMKDCPFQLDTILNVTRYINKGHFQTVCDDKLGNDHVLITETSKPLVGFQWSGWYYVCNTIAFGWKCSGYVYQKIGLVAMHKIRSLGVPSSLYIDDRHAGQLQLAVNAFDWSNYELAEAACFLLCYTLVDLGYTLGLDKSQLEPTQLPTFLGMGIDSLVLAFRLLNRKKVTVAQLREDILQQTEVPVKLLQKLTGKIGSFVLAVPAARLFCREMFSAIAEAEKQGRMVKIEGTVRKELEYWRFLDTWEGHIPWKPEKHEVVELSSDASGFRWAGVVSSDKGMTQCSDYWEQHETTEHISVKETSALTRTLLSVRDRVQNKRVDAKVDNQNLTKAWENQGGKSKALNRAIKELWETSVQLNIDLNLHYVPSRDNIADKPSRQCSPSDAKLMPRALLVAGPGQARGEGAKGSSSSRRVGTTVPNQETGVDAETNEMGPLGFPDSASMFQGAARVWVPAVNCSECWYPNDFDFNFCQKCGKPRVGQNAKNKGRCLEVNLTEINARYDEIMGTQENSAYGKQKRVLAGLLSEFLAALNPPKTMENPAPSDIVEFLIYKDDVGKTKVHKAGCQSNGPGLEACVCPNRLAFKTVDSHIGKLRAIFNERGKGGEWDERLGLGNPAASLVVKKYLKSVTEEQLQQGLTPRQAKPVFLEKIVKVCKLIEQRRQLETSAIKIFILARDEAIFKALFFAGDRVSDLMRCRTDEVGRLPSGALLFNHVFGKTLRDGRANTFTLEPTGETDTCPVAALDAYVRTASWLSIELRGGYLFRSTSREGHILVEPPSTSALDDAFRRYLEKAGLYEGETLHGCRAGCAISLHMAGASDDSVMNHIGGIEQQRERIRSSKNKEKEWSRAVKPLREGVQGRGEGEIRRRREVAHPPTRPLP